MMLKQMLKHRLALGKPKAARRGHHENRPTWKERYAELLRNRKVGFHELRKRIGELKLHSARTRRQVLETDVLRQVLPVRLKAIKCRGESVETQLRHETMLRTSASYRQLFDMEKSKRIADTGRVKIHDLIFRVPEDPRLPERLERARAQSLPWRIIAQTREIGIGSIMLDLGANIGRTSIPRVVLGDVRCVYAAEPDPDNYRCLTQNVWSNSLRGLVMPDNVAVGAGPGTLRFERSRFIGSHRVVGEGMVPKEGTEIIEVPAVAVDTWIEQQAIDVNEICFIKLDVQGWELPALQGARDVLGAKHIAWQVEIDPPQARRSGFDPAEFVRLLASSFTHFIDLNKHAQGSRCRPTRELAEAIAYLEGETHKTDIVLYSAIRN